MIQPTMPPPLAQAWQAQDRKALWEAYKAEWNSLSSPPMTSEIFNFLFADWGISQEAEALVRRSLHAKETIKSAAAQSPEELDIDDSFVSALFDSAFEPKEIIDLWREVKKRLGSAYQRSLWARFCVFQLVKQAGRAWVRQEVLFWWNDWDLLEEEREAIISGLNKGRALTRDLVRQLGPEAENLVRRSVAQGDLSSSDLMEPVSVPVFRAGTPEATSRLAALLELARIGIDLRDSNLSSAEVARLGNYPGNLIESDYFHKILNYLPPHLGKELREVLSTSRGGWFGSNGVDGHQRHLGGSPFLVPLIRLLHMRLILEAPALAPALARPEESLAPEVMLFLLGRDAVTYVPELRVHAEVDRRWRAKWAEITGEALSVLFLEEVLDLDLTTLNRIEERTDRETPDFQASTMKGEPIVFESKGSTDFRTHKRQRIKALGQVGKRGVGTSNANTWSEPGRAFACCLFAAKYGTDTSTLFYIADPPFAFRDLFHKGWEVEARRRHYAAVAEAAGLFELADSVLRGESISGEIEREPQSFRLDSGQANRTRGGERTEFLGTYTSLQEQARRLRHPRPELFDRVRMFTGLRADLVRKLADGECPAPGRRGETWPEEPEELEVQRAGILPDRENTGHARGVFSLLSDGAFLAFEIE